MKKILILLPLVLLAVCLVGFTIDRFVPASPASAASQAHPATSVSNPVENVSTPAVRLAQPVIYVVAGLVCGLFGLLAISPLLFGDPARKTRTATPPGRFAEDAKDAKYC